MGSIPPFFDEYSSDMSADVVVVGGGLSGLQFAKDAGKQVKALVLEAGPNLGTTHINWDNDADAALQQWQSPTADASFVEPWTAVTPPHYSGTSGLRRRLGGRSLYWHGVVLRMDQWALDPNWWPASIIRELPNLYSAQEHECGLDDVEPSTDAQSSLFHACGYPWAKPTPRAMQYNKARNRWAAYSPLAEWVTNPSSMPPIVCNTEVVSLLFNNGRVTGILGRNTRTQSLFRIESSAVILAAGTIENSRLAAGILSQSGHLTSATLSGLSDHLVSGCMFRIRVDEDHFRQIASEVPSLVLIPGTESSRSNYFAMLEPHSRDRRLVFVDIWGMGEQLPQDQNSIHVDAISGKTFVTADYSDADREVLWQQRVAVAEIVSRLMSHLVETLSVTPPSADEPVGTVADAYSFVASKPDEVLAPIWYVSSLGSVDHEGCTLPYGRLLNERGEFAGTQGLYALGPCTFPRLGAANPSLTTLALAKRTAQLFT